jgi:hypothetical protein
VKGNTELRKACHPDNSSGPQIGGQSSEFAVVMVGIVCSTISASFRW